MVFSHACIVCIISLFQIQARSESFVISLERDMVTAYLHHLTSRRSFLAVACSSHLSTLLLLIKPKPHCMCLFHALFDNFFTVEECKHAVPFCRPGSNSSGKEGKKVDGILSKFSKLGSVCLIMISNQDSVAMITIRCNSLN